MSSPVKLDGISPRPSLDGARPFISPPPNGTNGTEPDEDDANLDPVERLQRELQRTKEEKDTLATQYRNLLSKLTTMRTTLGNKLKQDAVRGLLIRVSHNYDLTLHRKNSTGRSSSCSS